MFLVIRIKRDIWRTVQKKEIDFVEDSNGQITAFEFKWQSKGKAKIPAVFLKD
jgi:hypothetical protein